MAAEVKIKKRKRKDDAIIAEENEVKRIKNEVI